MADAGSLVTCDPKCLTAVTEQSFQCPSPDSSKTQHICSPKHPRHATGTNAAMPPDAHSVAICKLSIRPFGCSPNRSRTESSLRHSSGSAISTRSSPPKPQKIPTGTPTRSRPPVTTSPSPTSTAIDRSPMILQTDPHTLSTSLPQATPSPATPSLSPPPESTSAVPPVPPPSRPR